MKPVIVVESQLLIEPLPTARPAEYAVVARLTQAFRRLLPGLQYEPANRDWEMADFEHRPLGWPKARRFVVARRLLSEEKAEPTLFALGPLRLSRLGHQPVIDSRWHLALLRWTRCHGTAHRRVAGGLRAAENPHPFFRGQCPIPGDHSSGLQPGHGVPTPVLARIMAELDSRQAALQAVLTPRRTHSPSDSSRAAAQ